MPLKSASAVSGVNMITTLVYVIRVFTVRDWTGVKGEAGEDRWRKKLGRCIAEFLFQFPAFTLLYETFMCLYIRMLGRSLHQCVGQNT